MLHSGSVCLTRILHHIASIISYTIQPHWVNLNEDDFKGKAQCVWGPLGLFASSGLCSDSPRQMAGLVRYWTNFRSQDVGDEVDKVPKLTLRRTMLRLFKEK